MKKLTSRVRKVNAQVIGLDVHKRMVAYCILDRDGQEIACGEIRGDAAALEALLKQAVGRKKTHFAFESSGHSLWVYDLLVARYGVDRVHVAQSKKIRAIANSREKNDANDAFWLAYLTYEGRLPEAYVPPADYRALRVATRERIEVVRRRAELFRRVRSHLAQLGRAIPSGSLRHARARDGAREVARQIGAERGFALELSLDEIERLDGAIGAWEDRIAAIADRLPAVQAIEQHLPGVGRVLASTIVAESGPIQRFATAKAYGRYTGLTPSERSSGGRTRHGGISREGSAYLRWALTQMTMGCTRARRGAGFAVGEWIRRKQRRMGNRGKARCAAARKLAESIWRLFQYGECFDPVHPFGARS